ncbi:peptidase M16 [Insulibacter thermoxylanivorax]|uniref:Peptidase M16 n=1 Tax=Insulibacter thermoxylanivorax TaxID=2749268 RepID=A0A916QDZ6_9BACL|nr:pitrilysin family protein [Insulibacter thermoxylanivorax]GFR37663.1 peptidase M16 [Insulibacter thermoxylanivorax]
MKQIHYEAVRETLYVEQLDNGLELYVLPKQGFSKTYATFTTRYGSIDNHFQVEGGEPIRVPDGVAHFLEHKMFEEPDGDVFAKFSSRGASANAFTSFDRTTYLFSATSHVEENLETLLDFVQRPYFSEESVNKEKGIIGQEIKMYQDHPDWRLYYGLVEALFQKHPVRIDIAGTIESISQIDRDTLLACHKAFYHPSNMMVFVAGGVDPQRIAKLVRDNQAAKSFAPQGGIKRFYEAEPEEVLESRRVTQLPVALPKCLIGFKEVNSIANKDPLKTEAASRVMLDVLFSPSSECYQTLYDEGLITDNFGHEFNLYPDFAYSAVGGDTKDPDRLTTRILEFIQRYIERGVDEPSFERSKRKRIGVLLRSMNSPEAIVSEYTKYKYRGIDWFQLLPTYEALTVDEVNKRIREHFAVNRMSVSIVTSGETRG